MRLPEPLHTCSIVCLLANTYPPLSEDVICECPSTSPAQPQVQGPRPTESFCREITTRFETLILVKIGFIFVVDTHLMNGAVFAVRGDRDHDAVLR